MRVGIAALVCGYLLSQFYRAFLAVLSPVLQEDLGATAADLASASGWWFLAFAAMQLPIGEGLDRIGPRRTAGGLMLVGAAGAALFAVATAVWQIKLAMALIGVGCAPVLMACYYIFARSYAPALFGTLAGVTIGVGSLGNVAASLPLSAAVEVFGWRGAVWGLAGFTGVVALGILALVRDPPSLVREEKGSLLDLLKIPAIWPILAMMAVCYTPVAGLRGLWVGPYFSDVHGFDAGEIGRISLWMGLAMVAGNFAYGPLDRWVGSRKWVIFTGNALTVLCVLGLWAFADGSPAVAAGLLVAAGLFRRKLSDGRGAWPGVHSAAHDGAGGDAAEPVRDCAHRPGADRHRAHPCGDPGGPRQRALSGGVPVLCRHHGHRVGDLPVVARPH